MREISLHEIRGERQEPDIEKAIKEAVKSAIGGLKAPIIKNTMPPVVIPEIKMQEKEKGSYLIRVNRDDNGRVQSMVVSPYEPI
jgi:hypothetical protein